MKDNLLMDGKEMELFEISLINRESLPLVRTCNSLRELPLSEDRETNRLLNFTATLPKNERMFPIVWIDCSLDNTTNSGNSASSEANISFKTIFQQILSRSVKFPQNSENTQLSNNKMLITSKLIEVTTDSPFQGEKKNIMLIHFTLFLNIK